MPAAQLRALWNYRGFVLGSVRREFQSRYRNSLLGGLWTVLNPLAMILVYTVIFSQVMRARMAGAEGGFSYSIYLCAGVLSWGLFAEIVGRSQNLFLDYANLLKKLSFPRLCLPLIIIINALVNFAIIFGLFLLFLLLTGNFPGWPAIALLPVIAVLVALAVGLGMVLGVFNVFFRDVGQFFSIFLQFWFWLTPIVYPIDILPATVQKWMQLNPMAAVIGACQSILLHATWPDWSRLWPVLLLAFVLCLWGWGLFRRHVGELVDEL